MIIGKFTVEIEQKDDSFETTFHDVIVDQQTKVVTAKFDMSDEQARRQALDGMYHVISHVLRKRAFPQDTPLYRTEKFPDGSAKATILGYPDGAGKELQPA